MATTQNFNYPSSSDVTVTGIGTPNNAAIPSESVLIAGENPSGNQTVVQTDPSGNLIVSPLSSSSTVTVVQPDGSNLHADIDSSALPTGASTSALQTTGNTTLSTIASDLTNGSQVTTVSGNVIVVQPTGTNLHTVVDSGSISVSNFPATQPVSGTVAVTQSTIPWSDNISQFGGAAVSLGSNVSASSIPVVIASDDTVAVSAVSLPLPTGAATSANQTSEITQLTTIATNTTGVSTAANQATIIANQTNGTQKSQAATPTALTVYQAAIAVGLTAVRLTVSGSAPASTRVVLVATPDSATTSTITFYIGSSTVTNSGTTRGIEIQLGQSFIANNDAGDYWIVASAASQTVTMMEQY